MSHRLEVAGLEGLEDFHRRLLTMPVRNPGTDRPLFTPTGDPVTIDVRNRYSTACERARYGLQSDWQSDCRSVLMAGPPADFLEEQAVTMAAAATAAWSGIVLDGAPIAMTREAAANLYRRLPWLREQVSTACNDLSRYGDPSLPTEPPPERNRGA